MNQVKLGIVGIGNMGTAHANNLVAGKIKGLQLAAVCDLRPDRLAEFPQIPGFTDSREMIRSGKVDAVLIATPHYDHTTIGIDALGQGLHVLVEKPLSVHRADCDRLIAAYEARPNPDQVFCAMFNQRTDPHYIKVRELIQSGELGTVRRITWNITNWFRPYAYYASGGWRATWAGEGGGVLLNQCPHNLDLWQWMFGKPDAIRAWCRLGFHHDNIEVEDDVTAYLEYDHGCSGVFITSTGEAPGSNRLEVAADRGKLVIGGDAGSGLKFTRNEVPTPEFSRTTKGSFSRPATWDVSIPVNGHGGQHNEILQNFADAILQGKPLIAPAVEGVHSVEMANAMLYSSFTGQTVRLPIDGPAYEKHLQKLIADSSLKKKVEEAGPASDFSKSHS